MSRPISPISAAAASLPSLGISSSRSAAGSPAASAARPASGPVTPSASTPRDAGIAARCPVTRDPRVLAALGQGRMRNDKLPALAEALSGMRFGPQHAHAAASLLRAVDLLEAELRELQERLLEDALCKLSAVVSKLAGHQTARAVIEAMIAGELSSRCQYLVRSAVRSRMCRVYTRSAPDLRHERGPQHPHLSQPRDPPRVLLVGLRPARQVPGLGGVGTT